MDDAPRRSWRRPLRSVWGGNVVDDAVYLRCSEGGEEVDGVHAVPIQWMIEGLLKSVMTAARHEADTMQGLDWNFVVVLMHFLPVGF
jgi:hypothetical protein